MHVPRHVGAASTLALTTLIATTIGCSGASNEALVVDASFDATSNDALQSSASDASDASVDADAYTPPATANIDAGDGEAAPSCPPTMQVALPATTVTLSPPSGGSVQTIQVTASGALGLYVRVFGSPSPKLTVSSTCDGATPATGVNVGSTATGTYAHGVLPTAGTWFVALDWSSVTPPPSFLFDALSFDAGPSCATPQAWDGVAPLSVMTYAGVDTIGGCSPAVFGQQFLSVSVPANSSFVIDNVASDASSSGSAVFEAAATCAAGTCSNPPASGALTLANVGDAGTTFIVGVTAADPMNAGPAQLSGTIPPTCNVNGQACGDAGQSICCNNACVEPGVSNSCGTACGQTCPSDPAGHGTAGCSGGQCVINCGTSGSATSACSVSLETDPANCGACATPCPSGATCGGGQCMCVGLASQPCGNCGTQTRTCTGGAWSMWSACSGEGACAGNDTQPCMGSGTQTCVAATCTWGSCSCGADTACAGTCTDVDTDAHNCGSCGNDCTMQAPAGATETCSGGVCSAPSCLTYYCPNGGDATTGCFLANGGAGGTTSACWDSDGCDVCAWNGTCNSVCSSSYVCGCPP